MKVKRVFYLNMPNQLMKITFLMIFLKIIMSYILITIKVQSYFRFSFLLKTSRDNAINNGLINLMLNINKISDKIYVRDNE